MMVKVAILSLIIISADDKADIIPYKMFWGDWRGCREEKARMEERYPLASFDCVWVRGAK